MFERNRHELGAFVAGPSALALVCSLTLTATAFAETVNVRALGAKGNGKADDTAAFRKAVEQLDEPEVGKLVIPAGQYRITETIKLNYKQSNDVIIEGEGGKSHLFWDGGDGGTLLRVNGAGQMQLRHLKLTGVPPKNLREEGEEKRAGILYHAVSGRAGHLRNRMAHVIFRKADVGIQMGEKRGDHTNADYSFAHIDASHLDTFFLVKNDQAVDFLFNQLFVVATDTVFDFQRGGNLTVHNAQLTKCGLFLNIEGGGRNAGTFICTNVRQEHKRPRTEGRDQLLKATNIEWEQALVRFIGFQDSQWTWFAQKGKKRWEPLCEIGAGVNVTFESSIFNGPVARVTGEKGKPGTLVIRECTFGFILPHQAIDAGKHGYFRVARCFTDHMQPLPRVVKWPKKPTMRVGANEKYEHRPAPKPITEGGGKARRAIERLEKQRRAWERSLREE